MSFCPYVLAPCLHVYAICLHEAQKCLDKVFMLLGLGPLPCPLPSSLLGTASVLCVWISDARRLPKLTSGAVNLSDRQDLSSSFTLAFDCLLQCQFLLPSNQNSSGHASETLRVSYSVQVGDILFAHPYKRNSSSVSDVLDMRGKKIPYYKLRDKQYF